MISLLGVSGFPRSRGDEPGADSDGPTWRVVFPAHAGMSLGHAFMHPLETSFPRSRGDEPAGLSWLPSDTKFSPLTRG